MVASQGGGSRAPTRVAIVGGGCAGLAAAWELAQQKNARGDPAFAITVYERSWKLGGKGSSVRDARGRILEHGLHVWMGFYENAFRLMRECYSKLSNEGPYDSIESAFFPESHLGTALRDGTGAWQAWTGYFPPAAGEPGTEIDVASNPFTLASYVGRMLEMVKTLILSVIASPSGPAATDRRKRWGYSDPVPLVDKASPIRVRPDGRSRLDAELGASTDADPSASADVLIERLARLVRVGALTTGAALVQALAILETILQQNTSLMPQQSRLLDLLEAIVKHTRRLIADFVEADEDLRRRTEIIDLVMTIIVGLYRDKVIVAPNGLEAIDDIDCREWLLKHGATFAAANSPFVRGLYDLAFAYRDGDKRYPALAAGQALRGALRMFFTYRGAIVWRLRAGMGDVVFSPLYRALSKCGVKFEFNCELTKVHFALDSGERSNNRVTGLAFQQSHTPLQQKQWTPLTNFVWPDKPTIRFNKLASPRTLNLRADDPGRNGFDAVVLALGKEDFVRTCGHLCDSMDRFTQMRDHVATVATQATQFWFGVDFNHLGWSLGPVVMTGLDGPLDSWADMTHTLAAEQPNLRGRYHPRAVAYLCGVIAEAQLPRGDDAERQSAALDLVKRNGRKYLQASGAIDKLVAPNAGNALNQQHFRANVNLSDRYALSLPGTLKHRVSPLDGSLENMTVAGDWTDCGFNEGCVEAAVMSGRLAAHALSGDTPTLDEIIGFNHP